MSLTIFTQFEMRIRGRRFFSGRLRQVQESNFVVSVKGKHLSLTTIRKNRLRKR